jgi:hypothetical protein
MRARRLLLAAVVVVALVVVGIGVAYAWQLTYVYPNPTHQSGDFCVAATGVSPLECTANDTRISQLSPDTWEACTGTAIGETANVQFFANLVIGAQTRYDLAMYIALDGGSAMTGTNCLKDVLQPVASPTPATGDPLNPSGAGPFANTDGDLCGEALSAGADQVSAFYQLHTATITCLDNNHDGWVDPVSTCLSWANNKDQYDCQGVTTLVPGPGTGSKCNCQWLNPGVEIYTGYDYGDLPDPPYSTYKPTGARHAVYDSGGDGAPDTLHGNPSVWLGAKEDLELNGQPNADATGDDIHPIGGTNDEDGVSTTAFEWWPGTVADGAGGELQFVVNSSDGTTCGSGGCTLYFWIDWNYNGVFDTGASAGEWYGPFPYTAPGTYTESFSIPTTATLDPTKNLYARFRLFDGVHTESVGSPTGTALNGEVEDYLLAPPTAVDVLDFSATSPANKTVALSWATASEVDNLGFNLYRAMTEDGPRAKLNKDLIPSAAPGTAGGASYAFEDMVPLTRVVYYWLEDVDIYGKATLHGPVSAYVKK